MKRSNRTAGIAAAASFALALAAAACGESSSITNPTPVAGGISRAGRHLLGIRDDFRGHRVGQHAARGGVGAELGDRRSHHDRQHRVLRIGGLRAGVAQLIVAKEGYEERMIEVMVDGDTQVDAVLVRQSESN